jgi:hypothetical protein
MCLCRCVGEGFVCRCVDGLVSVLMTMLTS